MSRQHQESHRRTDGKTAMETLRGRRTRDIDLPNESGRVDPRVRRPDVSGGFRKAAEGYRLLRDKGILGK